MDNILSWKADADITAVAALIRQDKVILGSSDTVLGLLAVANKNGHSALDHVKQRNEKPYLILAGSNEHVFGMIGSFKTAQMEKVALGLMDHFWPENFSRRAHPAAPRHSHGRRRELIEGSEREGSKHGPLTLVLPSKFISDNPTTAVRVPNHAGLLKLLAQTGPLFSTSANISGQPIPERLTDVDPLILNNVAAVINKDREHYPMVPSTIVDCTGEEVRILREGAIPREDIEMLMK